MCEVVGKRGVWREPKTRYRVKGTHATGHDLESLASHKNDGCSSSYLLHYIDAYCHSGRMCGKNHIAAAEKEKEKNRLR